MGAGEVAQQTLQITALVKRVDTDVRFRESFTCLTKHVHHLPNRRSFMLMIIPNLFDRVRNFGQRPEKLFNQSTNDIPNGLVLLIIGIQINISQSQLQRADTLSFQFINENRPGKVS